MRTTECPICKQKIRVKVKTNAPTWHRDPLSLRKWCKGSPGFAPKKLRIHLEQAL